MNRPPQFYMACVGVPVANHVRLRQNQGWIVRKRPYRLGWEMPKTDELREQINYLKSFLTVLVGVVVLTISGLVSLYMENQVTPIFWFGIAVVAVRSCACLGIMRRIETYLQQLGEL